jgi:hypothetical protein
MAKLSYKALEDGRALVREHDLDGLVAWIERTRVIIDIEVVKTTFGRVFKAGNTETALRLFNAAFMTADPVMDRVRGYVGLAVLIFVALGLAGGVMYLFNG